MSYSTPFSLGSLTSALSVQFLLDCENCFSCGLSGRLQRSGTNHNVDIKIHRKALFVPYLILVLEICVPSKKCER